MLNQGDSTAPEYPEANRYMSHYRSLSRNIATLGPIGHAPKAPGTWGSLAALISAPWLFLPWEWPVRLVLLALVFIAGAWSASACEEQYACKDPGQVVIDELLGQWAALLFVSPDSLWLLIPAFLLFRLLDIVKPWPVRASETWLPGGGGIMIDDLLAGLLAGTILLPVS